MKHRRLTGLLSAAVLMFTSVPGMTASAGTERDVGVKDGYHWELWNEGGQGNPQMTVGNNGTFSCSWSGIKNVLFRSGQKFEDYPKWKSLNGITLDFKASEYNPQGNSYLCVYGWTKQPLAEYYIVENYGNWRPPGESDNMKKVGEITVDGGVYEVYKGTHDGPSIEDGVTHFNQYWSVRKENQLRNSGTIDIAAHFSEWERFGIEMGGLYEVALNVEGWMSSGTATISQNDLTLGDYVKPEPEPEVSFSAPSGKGSGVSDAFEGPGTDWSTRGDGVKYGFNQDFVHGGTQSLYVTGRDESWHGVSIASDELKAGETYTFSSYVGYNSKTYPEETFVLGLQYTLDGDTKYDNLAETDAESGKWAALGTEFTIPEGASKISLYVQTEYTETPTAKDKISFYLDDVQLSGAAAVQTTAPAPETTAPAVTTVSSTTAPVTTDLKPTLRGDADCSGTVDVSDAVLVARFANEDRSAVITAQGIANGDVNDVKGLDSGDITRILRAIAKIESL